MIVVDEDEELLEELLDEEELEEELLEEERLNPENSHQITRKS